MELRKTFQIEAAHRLPNVPTGHKCARLHGHSWRIEVAIEGPVGNDTGWVMDYADLKAAFQPIHDQIDHNYLNEIPGLENPTSERLAVWLWNELKPRLPLLIELVIAETCTDRGYAHAPTSFLNGISSASTSGSTRPTRITPMSPKPATPNGESYRLN